MIHHKFVGRARMNVFVTESAFGVGVTLNAALCIVMFAFVEMLT